MAFPTSYVKEIESLKKEIKRLNSHLKSLRQQRKQSEKHLYNYMVANNLESYEGITAKSIKPKAIQRKPLSQKKSDAIKLFRDSGIEDAEKFWDEFQATQRYNNENTENIESEPRKSRPKKKKDDFDPLLGF